MIIEAVPDSIADLIIRGSHQGIISNQPLPIASTVMILLDDDGLVISSYASPEAIADEDVRARWAESMFAARERMRQQKPWQPKGWRDGSQNHDWKDEA